MLRCRPSEIALAPSDIAYAKQRLALYQAAKRNKQISIPGVQHSTSPRLRRGPQRSRDEAIIHPNDHVPQSRPLPYRHRQNNQGHLLDGAADSFSSTSHSANSEESSIEEFHHGHVVNMDYKNEDRDGTNQIVSISLPSKDKICGHKNQLSHHCVTQSLDTGSAIGCKFYIISKHPLLIENLIAAEVEDVWLEPKEERVVSHNQKTELPVGINRPVISRSKSARAFLGDIPILKRTAASKLSIVHPSKDALHEHSSSRELEQTSEGTSKEVKDNTKGSKEEKQLAGHRYTAANSRDLSSQFNSLSKVRCDSFKPPSASKADFLSYSAYDLASFRPKGRSASNFSSYPNLGDFSKSRKEEEYLDQIISCKDEQIMMNPNANIAEETRTRDRVISHSHQYLFSMIPSDRSSQVATSSYYRRQTGVHSCHGSPDYANALNIPCYGRSCSSAVPGVTTALVEAHPILPQSPKFVRSYLKRPDRRNSSSGSSGASLSTRSSIVSEATSDVITRKCSPLEQIQNDCARLCRIDGKSSYRWRLFFSEPCLALEPHVHAIDAQPYSSERWRLPGTSTLRVPVNQEHKGPPSPETLSRLQAERPTRTTNGPYSSHSRRNLSDTYQPPRSTPGLTYVPHDTVPTHNSTISPKGSSRQIGDPHARSVSTGHSHHGSLVSDIRRASKLLVKESQATLKFNGQPTMKDTRRIPPSSEQFTNSTYPTLIINYSRPYPADSVEQRRTSSHGTNSIQHLRSASLQPWNSIEAQLQHKNRDDDDDDDDDNDHDDLQQMRLKLQRMEVGEPPASANTTTTVNGRVVADGRMGQTPLKKGLFDKFLRV